MTSNTSTPADTLPDQQPLTPEDFDAQDAVLDALREHDEEIPQWEPPAQTEARAAALLAGMLLARIDGKSPAEYITTDAGRDRVRHFAIPLLLQPERSLHAIAQRWSTE